MGVDGDCWWWFGGSVGVCCVGYLCFLLCDYVDCGFYFGFGIDGYCVFVVIVGYYGVVCGGWFGVWIYLVDL